MAGAFAYDLYKNRDVLSAADLPVIAVGFVAAFVMARDRGALPARLRVAPRLCAVRLVAADRRRRSACSRCSSGARSAIKPAPQKIERQQGDADPEPVAERLFRHVVEQRCRRRCRGSPTAIIAATSGSQSQKAKPASPKTTIFSRCWTVMAAAWVATSALRSLAKNCAKSTAISGPVAPTNMDSSARHDAGHRQTGAGRAGRCRGSSPR